MGRFKSVAEIQEGKAAARGSRFKAVKPSENYKAPKQGRFREVPGFRGLIRLTAQEQHAAALAKARENSRIAAAKKRIKRDSYGRFINDAGKLVCGAVSPAGKVCMVTGLGKDGKCAKHGKKAADQLAELKASARKAAEVQNAECKMQNEPEAAEVQNAECRMQNEPEVTPVAVESLELRVESGEGTREPEAGE